jgi:P27 family predicted phage terminase small subunit
MQRAKPVDLKSGDLSNEKKQIRKEIETRLQGSEGIPSTPPNSLCAAGKQVYREIVNTFPQDFLSRTDAYVVTVVADAIAQLTKLREQINVVGPTAASETKLIISYQKYSDILKKFSPELGLSPQSRSQLAHLVTKEKEIEKDPLLKVLKGQK